MHDHVAAVERQRGVAVLHEALRGLRVRPEGFRQRSREPALRHKGAHPGAHILVVQDPHLQRGLVQSRDQAPVQKGH